MDKLNVENDQLIIINEEDLAVLPQAAYEPPHQADIPLRILPGLHQAKDHSSFYAVPSWQAAILGSLAALAGWWLIEIWFPHDPFLINPFGSFNGQNWLTNVFPAGMIGIFLGLLEGMKARNWLTLLWKTTQALAFTISGGVLGGLLAQLAYLWLSGMQGDLFISILAPVAGWTVVGLFIGLSQAIISGNGYKLAYGMISGLLGGVLGGLLFSWMATFNPEGDIARMAAFAILGGSIGWAAGFADHISVNEPRKLI